MDDMNCLRLLPTTNNNAVYMKILHKSEY